MTWLMSDDPPTFASTGALRWMSRNVDRNGAVVCATCVSSARVGGIAGDTSDWNVPQGERRLALVGGDGVSSGHNGFPWDETKASSVARVSRGSMVWGMCCMCK